MSSQTETPNILLTVEDDVRVDLQLTLDPFPHSIPSHNESGYLERWHEEAYDRTFARFWGW